MSSVQTFIKDIWVNDQLTFWSLAFIVAWFVAGLCLTTLRVARRSRQVRRALMTCSTLPGDRQRKRAAACAAVREVTGMSYALDAYERWWRASVIPSRDSALGTKTLEDFLAPSDLLPSWSRAIAGTWPGILVALGILGTFIGLVLGLPAVGEAGKVTSESAFGGFVQTITKSLGLAFWTSILGITFSVLFLIIDRTCVSQLEDGVHRLSRRLGELFPTLAPEEVQRLQMDRLEDLNASVKNIGVDLAQSLANYMGPAIGQALHAELTPAVGQIQAAVDRLLAFSTDGQADAVKGLVEGFMTTMNTALGDQFEQLRTVIGKTVAAQEHIGEGVNTFTLQLRSTAQSQGALIERTTRLANALTGTVERFEGIVSGLNEASDSFGDFASALADSAQAVAASSEQSAAVQRELATRLDAERESIERARVDLTASWETAIKQAQDSIALIDAAARQASIGAQNQAAQLAASWEGAVGKAEGVIHQITEAARQIGQGVGDQLVNALSSFDSALAEVVQRFSGTLAQVDATVGELPPVALAIKDSISSVNEQITRLQSSTSALDRLVRDQLVQYGKDTATAAGHLQGAMQSVMKSMQGGIQTQNTLLQATDALTATLSKFGSGVEDLQTAAATLLDTSRQIRSVPFVAAGVGEGVAS